MQPAAVLHVDIPFSVRGNAARHTRHGRQKSILTQTSLAQFLFYHQSPMGSSRAISIGVKLGRLIAPGAVKRAKWGL